MPWIPDDNAMVREESLMAESRMSEQELIEALADKEHASWARWMHYLFSKCYETYDGNYVIPVELVDRWRKQLNTSYAKLSEQKNKSHREEVAHTLPPLNNHPIPESIQPPYTTRPTH